MKIYRGWKALIIILFGSLTDGERNFVNKIFLKMNIKMYNISFNILKDKLDAEEALAQTFLKIIDNIDKISKLPCPQIEPYCVIIVKNETMNIIRKREKIVPTEDVDYFDHSDRDYNIEEEYLKTVNKEKLLSCINKLSDEEKHLLHLRFVNEMKFKNISKLLGITEEAAKKRGQRILRKLRSYYEEGGKNVQNI
jgi:RNA polymerase sigma-70 factor (ECF subfamily)